MGGASFLGLVHRKTSQNLVVRLSVPIRPVARAKKLIGAPARINGQVIGSIIDIIGPVEHPYVVISIKTSGADIKEGASVQLN
ncbi:Uncharacterised protein [uncultured archaeon]|nr:Uncharacterised protein [uncultured archaeon]